MTPWHRTGPIAFLVALGALSCRSEAVLLPVAGPRTPAGGESIVLSLGTDPTQSGDLERARRVVAHWLDGPDGPAQLAASGAAVLPAPDGLEWVSVRAGLHAPGVVSTDSGRFLLRERPDAGAPSLDDFEAISRDAAGPGVVRLRVRADRRTAVDAWLADAAGRTVLFVAGREAGVAARVDAGAGDEFLLVGLSTAAEQWLLDATRRR